MQMMMVMDIPDARVRVSTCLTRVSANCDLEAGQHVHSLPDCDSHFRYGY